MNDYFDGFGVPAELAQQVFAAQLQLRGAYRDSLRVGAGLGALLARAKEACGHGEFEKWLSRHFKGTPRHARNLMRLAKRYPDPQAIPPLSLREALRVIAEKCANEKVVMANDRLSGTTCCEILATFPEVLEPGPARTNPLLR